MYTIGQIANIIGVSRDKLRYYEEKGILAPKQNYENNYREYNFKDIDSILAIEFYRSLDLDFKTINKIYKKSDIKDIEYILDKKYDEIMKEIARLNNIVSRVEEAKRACNEIEKYLNKFTIRSMKPIKILGEISDFRAYDEFNIVHKNKSELDENAIIKSLKRYITFTEKGIESNKMFITKDIEDDNKRSEGNILEYEKCAYTIVQDSEDNDVMGETFSKSLQWGYNNGYSHKGIALISMILLEHSEDIVKSYLEVYIPIE